MMRSKLFVPGSRPEFFEKAMTGAADALSFDLEDAVAPSRKADARRNVGDLLARLPRDHAKLMIVRVNAVGSAEFDEDIDAIVRIGLDEINLPKLESPEELLRGIAAIEAAEKRHGLAHHIGILANVESPKGMRRAAEIACASVMKPSASANLPACTATPARWARATGSSVSIPLRRSASTCHCPIAAHAVWSHRSSATRPATCRVRFWISSSGEAEGMGQTMSMQSP